MALLGLVDPGAAPARDLRAAVAAAAVAAAAPPYGRRKFGRPVGVRAAPNASQARSPNSLSDSDSSQSDSLSKVAATPPKPSDQRWAWHRGFQKLGPDEAERPSGTRDELAFAPGALGSCARRLSKCFKEAFA